ncbi:MAG: hypothetical protein FWF51_07625 [Chitinivibrionia bacterium]|nr:hypothetical protein [Chitinivibrionia bacterium]
MINSCGRDDSDSSSSTTTDDPTIPDKAKYKTEMELLYERNLSDGSTTPITIELKKTDTTSSSNAPEAIPGAKVTLSVDASGAKINNESIGSRTPLELTTNSTGVITIPFSADLGERESETYKITFKYADIDTSISIFVTKNVMPGPLKFVSDSLYSIRADGKSSIGLTAIAVDLDNVSLAGQKIIFRTTKGRLTVGNAQTGNDGIAKTEIISVKENGYATVYAQLASDPSSIQSVVITFEGMTLTLNPDRESIKPGVDILTVKAVLKDALSNYVFGDSIEFSGTTTLKLLETEKAKKATNGGGEAEAKFSASNVGNKETDTIFATAAGVQSMLVIHYSNSTIEITAPNANGLDDYKNPKDPANNYTVSPRDTVGGKKPNYTKMKATFKDPEGRVKSGVELSVSVSAGGIVVDPNDSNKTAPSFTANTNADGVIFFAIRNPEFSGELTISVDSKKTESSQKTNGKRSLYIKAGSLHRITLEATPEVVPVGATNSVQVIATAYDVAGNLVAGEKINFSMVGGSSGAGYLEDLFNTTETNGKAEVKFRAGNTASEQQGVRIFACSPKHCDSIRSDTVVITVAENIKNVSLSYDIGNISGSTGVYSINFAVITSDINNNPIADGMDVVFSTRIVGIANFQKVPYISPDKKTYGVDYKYKIRPVHDYNFNGIRDNGECPYGVDCGSGTQVYPLPRGELIIAGAQKHNPSDFNPDSPFWDINGNGLRDSLAYLPDVPIQIPTGWKWKYINPGPNKFYDCDSAIQFRTEIGDDTESGSAIGTLGSPEYIKGGWYFYNGDDVDNDREGGKYIAYPARCMSDSTRETIYVSEKGAYEVDNRTKDLVEPFYHPLEVIDAAPEYAGLTKGRWKEAYPLVKRDVVGTIEKDHIIYNEGDFWYIDYNKNGSFDWYELWQPGSTKKYAQSKGKYTIWDEKTKKQIEEDYIDIDFNGNGIADPTATIGVSLPKAVKTTGGRGVATNTLTYGQTDALYLCIEVWAEVAGVKSNVLRFEPLPATNRDAVLQFLFENNKRNLQGGF